MSIATIDTVIKALRQGRMIILADDEQRENEGDFIMAAEAVSADAISFMAEQAMTIITLALTPERCSQLGLKLMAAQGGNAQDTAFTVTIEAAKGVSTGSSAHDRAVTIKAALAHDAKPEDLVSPGHVFPLRAVPGGVLNRAGHTEAACDLARAASLEPAGLISEIQLANGKMARMPDLVKIAQKHDMPLTTIAELIRHRLESESLVSKFHQEQIETSHGKFTVHYYQDSVGGGVHVALERSNGTNEAKPPLVRVIVNPNFCDYLAMSSARSWSIPAALERFGEEGHAILLALQVEQPGSLKPITLQQEKASETHLVRTYGIGAQVLRDLGVTDMRLLSSPLRLPSMEGFGLNVTEIIQP